VLGIISTIPFRSRCASGTRRCRSARRFSCDAHGAAHVKSAGNSRLARHTFDEGHATPPGVHSTPAVPQSLWQAVCVKAPPLRRTTQQ
jgi:hypothetical protein